jgi:hypothetical protein
MPFTPKQVLSYISGQIGTTPEVLVYGYENDPKLRIKLDICIDDINSRRIKNGLEPVIISQKLLVESE